MSRVIKFSPHVERNDSKPVEIQHVFQRPQSRNENVPTPTVDLQKVHEDAEQIIKQAKEEADRLMSEAQINFEMKEQALLEKEASIDERIEEALAQAHRQGYEEGYQQGKDQSETEYKQYLHEARDILSQAQSHYEAKLLEAEPELIRLSVRIAEKIIGQKLEEEETWKGFISEALHQVKQEEEIKIFISPQNYDRTLPLTTKLSKSLDSDIVLYPDETQSEQGCLIETRYGQIDASINSQLDEMEAKLLEIVGEVHGNRSNSGSHQ
ncbi:flagellar assembly protein FliH [Pseudalkalibacillus sp. SCS-8]|uniref:flagellar assembly protein FliH n=1 Tax=Pseudalkalibacillus nanhaiensis TaxID=3115291 RepID=UPI0032DBCDF0